MKAAHKPKKPELAKTLACLLVASLLLRLPLFAVEEHPPQAGEIGWQHAVKLRTQLENSPANQRTAERFQEVMDAFRQVYRLDPNIPKAPAAMAAVADLLVERGRLLKETGSLRAAILQYELMRKQYPHSDQVRMALLLEAEICRQDLKDAACAQKKLHAVIAAYPGTSFAEQAELELSDLDAGPAPASKTPPATETAAATESAPEPVAAPLAATRTPGRSPKKPAPIRAAVPTQVPASTPVAAPEAGDDSSQTATPDAAAADQSPAEGSVTVTGIRHWSNPTSTRIAIDLSGKVSYEAGRVSNPDRIYFDLHGGHLSAAMRGHTVEQIDDGFLKRIRTAQFKTDVARFVLDVNDVWEYSAFLLPNPWRLIIDVHGSKAGPKAGPKTRQKGTPQKTPMDGASPPLNRQDSVASSRENTEAEVASVSSDPSRVAGTSGPTSLPMATQVGGSGKDGKRSDADSNAPAGKRNAKHAPAPRLPRIVIDAGHGGNDPGTLGSGGIEEKEVVLDVALRTGKLLQKHLGVDPIYTRSDDTYVPLEARTAIANKAQADLFLSIHGNSSPEPSARGVETYYLNVAGNASAVNVAERENALSTHSVHQLSDLVRKITLKERIEQSREFALQIDHDLYAGLKTGNPGLRDRGAKRAPFVVLIGAQMPSVLAEISFLTNPQDARKLEQPAYRQRIAQALASGVEQYLKEAHGTQPAPKLSTRSAMKASKTTTKTVAGNEELAQADGQRGSR